MKKTVITILKFICIFLPILAAGNRTMFEIAVIIWPIASISLLVFYIKGYNSYKNTRDVLEEYRKFDKVEKKRKDKKEVVIEETSKEETSNNIERKD